MLLQAAVQQPPPSPAQQPSQASDLGWIAVGILIAILIAAGAVLIFLVRKVMRFQRDTEKALADSGYNSVSELVNAIDRQHAIEAGRGAAIQQVGISSGVLPGELTSALTRLDSLQTVFPRVQVGHIRSAVPNYSLIKYTYTGVGAVEQMQKDLQRFCADRFGPPKDPPYDVERQYFDAFQRPEIAVCNEVVYTFPFFLTWQRRSTWGVVPYGHHRFIGLLIHPSHPSFEALAETDAFRDGFNVTPEHLGDSPAWISRILHGVTTAKGHLYARDGYLHQEILALAVLASGNDRTQSQYLSNSIAVPSSAMHPSGIPQEMLNEASWGTSLAIVDLAMRDEVMNTIQPYNLKLITVSHGLAIPVGVGFSILMTRHLSANGTWKDLLQAAHKSLAEEDTAISMLRSGIQLDWSLVRAAGNSR